MDDAARDALLIRLDERTLRADKALFGNGLPGVLTTVAAAVSRIDAIERETAAVRPSALKEIAELGQMVKDIDARAPTPQEKRAGWVAVSIALIAAIGSVVVSLLNNGMLRGL